MIYAMVNFSYKVRFLAVDSEVEGCARIIYALGFTQDKILNIKI